MIIKVKHLSSMPTIEASVMSLCGIALRVGLYKIHGAINLRFKTPLNEPYFGPQGWTQV